MKQIIIRTRRELETQSGSSITLEELLGLYNYLIHDLEISHGSQKEKQKPKKPEDGTGAGEPTKPKRRSLLSMKDKEKPKKNVFYVPQTPIMKEVIISISIVFIPLRRFVKWSAKIIYV